MEACIWANVGDNLGAIQSSEVEEKALTKTFHEFNWLNKSFADFLNASVSQSMPFTTQLAEQFIEFWNFYWVYTMRRNDGKKRQHILKFLEGCLRHLHALRITFLPEMLQNMEK
jgi:hypothetical protein